MDRVSKVTLPHTITRRIFKSSAKDPTRRQMKIVLQGSNIGFWFDHVVRWYKPEDCQIGFSLASNKRIQPTLLAIALGQDLNWNSYASWAPSIALWPNHERVCLILYRCYLELTTTNQYMSRFCKEKWSNFQWLNLYIYPQSQINYSQASSQHNETQIIISWILTSVRTPMILPVPSITNPYEITIVLHIYFLMLKMT